VQRARSSAEVVAGGVDAEGTGEVAMFQQHALDSVKNRAKKIQAQLDKFTNTAKTARQRIQRKECAENEALRSKTIQAIGDYMDAKEMSFEQLYSHMAGAADSDLHLDKFVAFVGQLYEHLGDKLDEDGEAPYKELFTHASGGADTLSQAKVKEMLLMTYKVVKAAMIAAGNDIGSKAVRRLEEGEHVQALDCPRKDAASGVTRVKCKAVNDEVEGFVSVSGNKGTVFLEPCNKYLACLKETVMTAELDVTSDTIRKLSKDELLEVIQFPTKEPSCGVLRVKAKALSDTTIGWVSVAGNAGTLFLEAC